MTGPNLGFYFYGASNEESCLCGDRGYIYLYENCWYSYSVGLEEGSNNYGSLNSLRLLLRLVVDYGAMNIQIFGDSLEL